MYRIITCTGDTYIVNKIIDNSFRATDANVGHAATLDLFKLCDESSLVGTSEPIELSRLLVKFDLNAIRALTGSVIDPSHSSFNVVMKLTDVVGGQPTPSNFTVIVHPVSKSWNEGVGRDVGRFSDIGVANWITASNETGIDVEWNSPGAAAEGLLGSDDIDIISSGNLNDGLGLRSLYATQLFSSGDEDLEIDVTNIVSATLCGLLPDEGFRIAFSGSLEVNSSSLFVKRFGSRHSPNSRIHPSLLVKFDDSLTDNHANFIFDVSGSLYLFNTVRGQRRNLISGSAATQITGSNSLTLTLISGNISSPASQSFSSSYNVSQFSYGNNYVTGVYSVDFAVSSFHSALMSTVNNVGSASFHTVWGSNDGTVPFYTGTLVVHRSDVGHQAMPERQLIATIPSHRAVYRRASVPRIRVNVFDVSVNNGLTFSRIPLKPTSIVVNLMHWRLVDQYSGEIVIPFDRTYNSTKLSTDADGMYFDFYPEDLVVGRVYGFEFLIVDSGEELILDKNLPTFRIEP